VRTVPSLRDSVTFSQPTQDSASHPNERNPGARRGPRFRSVLG